MYKGDYNYGLIPLTAFIYIWGRNNSDMPIKNSILKLAINKIGYISINPP